ncbi:hypothetical protein FE236_03880 [Mariprofundus erugo]|uniref:Uncharacterized protein n=1 Tax=Mariprofundus erugo TaxID=2528639 RepID=A0A5R9GPZ6_9PROT|nr:hypothetical protein [Mariprofundus erugo]TLS67009.1 hypothetical protein FEF65_08645 [Mariprofundus erugo]TLS77289.1 hypothetical protein FE236_03880 [Mariprofundus erugo]
MIIVLFLLFSIPIGLFSGWFAWKAFRVGKRRVGWGMCWLSLFSFASALVVALWVYAVSVS